MEMIVRDKKELSKIEIQKIITLIFTVWPPKEEYFSIEEKIENYKKENSSFNKILLYFDNNILIGHTEIFSREIIVESKKIKNMALAGVCINHEYRGKNIGLKIVNRAFEYIENHQFECSVFQTQVPEFYKKLNCKIIDNTFINTKSKGNINKNPWWDPYIMVYPYEFDLGELIIDLNGNGY
jgi:N-acetylglutamate synthase-like GNAT family acetyltransferase